MRRALRTVGILFEKAVGALAYLTIITGGGLLLCSVVGWGVGLASPALSEAGPAVILGFLVIANLLAGVFLLWAIYATGAQCAKAVADAWWRAGR